MNREEGLNVIRVFARWIDFMKDIGRDPIGVDVEHSALLKWMLEGNEPLPKAPPLVHAYPCYELGQGKPVIVHDIFDLDIPGIGHRTVIDGYHDWVLCSAELESHTEDGWVTCALPIYRHVPTGDLYTLTDHTLQKVQ